MIKHTARYSSRYLFRSGVSKSHCFKTCHAAQVLLPCWEYITWWASSTNCAGLGSYQIFRIPTDGTKWASRKCCHGGHSSLQGNLCELALYHHSGVTGPAGTCFATCFLWNCSWSCFPLVYLKVSLCQSYEHRFPNDLLGRSLSFCGTSDVTKPLALWACDASKGHKELVGLSCTSKSSRTLSTSLSKDMS